MPILPTVLIVLLGYIALVALMEGLIGFMQPDMDDGILLTTSDAQGAPVERKLALARIDGKLYIGSNHCCLLYTSPSPRDRG